MGEGKCIKRETNIQMDGLNIQKDMDKNMKKIHRERRGEKIKYKRKPREVSSISKAHKLNLRGSG